MKKFIASILIFVWLFAFASCEKKAPSDVEGTTQKTTELSVTVTDAVSSEETETVFDTVLSAVISTTAAAKTTAVMTAPKETAGQTSAEKPVTVSATVAETTAQPSIAPTVKNERITVSLSVNCKNAVDAGYEAAEKISADGVILGEKSVEINKDSTVFDLLNQCGLVIGSSSSAAGKYVYSINSLSEKDCGNKSGWIYKVNGTVVQKACSAYILNEGDAVEWIYTLNGGRDV